MLPRPHFAKLVERVRLLPPLSAAVVFPVDRESLQLALSGAFAGYLAPTLVGPESRVRDEALRAGLDISRVPLVDTPDDPRAAGERAASLARGGKVGALIRGTISHEHLLAPVAATDSGLRTDRRLSHATFLDVPGVTRPLVLTDSVLNVAPNLAAKREILLNALMLAGAIGVTTPRVALLAAKNVVSPAIPSTVEAAALKSMAAQRMFGDAILDGPFTPDVALAADAAGLHGVRSAIAGHADLLLAPTMESATMVLRTLTAVTGALAAGLVLGAKVPIVLGTPFESMETRMAGCVLATLTAAAARESAVAERDAEAAAVRPAAA